MNVHQLGSSTHAVLIERLRQLYVESLPGLTKPWLSAPTPEEQQRWFAGLDRNRELVFLFSADNEPWNMIGYAKITFHDEYATHLYGVTESQRGKGYGVAILEWILARTACTPNFSTQLASNGASRRAHEKTGWQIVGRRGAVEYIFHPNSYVEPE